MNLYKTVKTVLTCGLISCIGILVLISLIPFRTDCSCPGTLDKNFININPLIAQNAHSKEFKHKLAVLVPFRERFEELLEFVPHISTFLRNQNVNHHIFVLHQIDRYRFNRASLINVGFIFSKTDFDYIAMHDVDLLPLNDDLRYVYPAKGPLHIASPELHPKYHYETFVGGILLIKREHYLLVNGMSNNYWGWGLEDDEFYVRLKEAKLTLYRPRNITTGTEGTFRFVDFEDNGSLYFTVYTSRHIHNRFYRKRDSRKCFNQKEVTRKRDKKTGLNSIQYNITKINKLQIDGVPATIINIFLHCDVKQTPWCDCEGTSK